MKKFVKKLLLGLLIWLVPFIVSIFVWDPITDAPRFAMDWFKILMSFSWTIGFSIAAYLNFKDLKKDTVKEGWITGMIWYIELLILDFIVLVNLFGMPFVEYTQFFVIYASVIVLSVLIGNLKR